MKTLKNMYENSFPRVAGVSPSRMAQLHCISAAGTAAALAGKMPATRFHTRSQTLTDCAEQLPGSGEVGSPASIACDRQRPLPAQAEPPGRNAFAEKPGNFARRMRRHRRCWRGK